MMAEGEKVEKKACHGQKAIALGAERGDKKARCITYTGSKACAAWQTEGPAKGGAKFGNGSITDAEEGIRAVLDHGHKLEWGKEKNKARK
jgi:hypothetical protein